MWYLWIADILNFKHCHSIFYLNKNLVMLWVVWANIWMKLQATNTSYMDLSLCLSEGCSILYCIPS
jgi:hypothetical protein